jgi:hypothetical protein
MYMRELYIGDFKDPDAGDESWDQYIKRKEKEDASKMSNTQRLILIAIFGAVVFYLYQYLTAGQY